MTGFVLGISGSPIPDSNTDRAVQEILKQTGLEHQFIKLSSVDLHPCRACLGCVDTNECVVRDAGPSLAGLFQKAQAFVLGGYTPYSSLDSRTKMFMERMYCQRHRTGLNRGKFGVSVITTAMPADAPGLPPAAQTAAAQIEYWMMEEGMTNLGSLVVHGNVPCIQCGYGDNCAMSGITMIHGPLATVKSVGVNDFDANAALLETARQLGQKIRESVLRDVNRELNCP